MSMHDERSTHSRDKCLNARSYNILSGYSLSLGLILAILIRRTSAHADQRFSHQTSIRSLTPNPVANTVGNSNQFPKNLHTEAVNLV
jgi:hypothetical protein